MNGPRQLKVLFLVSLLLLLISAGTALGVWGNARFAAGLALGFVLGAAPFLTWAWILRHGLSTSRGRVLAILVVFLKLALYAGALYLFVTGGWADPIGVFAGITGVVLVFCVGTLLGTSTRPKEVAAR